MNCLKNNRAQWSQYPWVLFVKFNAGSLLFIWIFTLSWACKYVCIFHMLGTGIAELFTLFPLMHTAYESQQMPVLNLTTKWARISCLFAFESLNFSVLLLGSLYAKGSIWNTVIVLSSSCNRRGGRSGVEKQGGRWCCLSQAKSKFIFWAHLKQQKLSQSAVQ